MKLSMWIFAEWLKDFEPELNIREGGLEIETVRLFSSEPAMEDDCIYVGRIRDLFSQGNDNVICAHKNDIIVLPTNEIDLIMNQILNAFEYYQSWNVRILEAISANRRPSDILAVAEEVIHEPVYLLDSNQYVIALSAGYGHHSVNEFWDQMLDYGSAEIAFLNKLNQVFPEHMTNRGLYYFNLPFLPQKSYNYNMFLEHYWIGLCSMIELHPPLSRCTIDLFHIFCQNMELWFISHSQEQRSLMIDSLFREALMSEEAVNENFVRQCQIHFEHLSDEKYILVLRPCQEQSFQMGHVCKELNLTFRDLIAIIYQKYICVLVNLQNGQRERLFSEILPLLKRNGYYGGCSKPFDELGRIRQCYEEALYVTDQMEQVSGTMGDFMDYSLHYILQEMKRNSHVNFIHPSVQQILDYDREHNTEFALTLYTYLKKERSQSRTAAALNLHRNTLTYRLQRLRQLLECDLEEDDTRLHMLLSFQCNRELLEKTGERTETGL